MAIVRRLLVWAVLFGLGLLFGPLLVAAIAGMTASSDEQARWRNAYLLLNAYDQRYPQYELPSIDWQGAAADCGYDFEQLFGGATPPLAEGRGWTPFTGYFDLILLGGREFRQEVERQRVEHLLRQFGSFELAFFNACLRETVFAGWCGRRVGNVLERGGLLSPSSLPTNRPRFEERREAVTMCRYLDGLAARQGQPLADPAGPRAVR